MFRCAVMSDIELPDFGAHSELGIDLEKGIFLRRGGNTGSSARNDDSGNNSMNTNRYS